MKFVVRGYDNVNLTTFDKGPIAGICAATVRGNLFKGTKATTKGSVSLFNSSLAFHQIINSKLRGVYTSLE